MVIVNLGLIYTLTVSPVIPSSTTLVYGKSQTRTYAVFTWNLRFDITRTHLIFVEFQQANPQRSLACISFFVEI